MKTLVILIPNQTIEFKLNNSPLYPEIGICMQYVYLMGISLSLDGLCEKLARDSRRFDKQWKSDKI